MHKGIYNLLGDRIHDKALDNNICIDICNDMILTAGKEELMC